MNLSRQIDWCVAARRGVAAIEFALVAPLIVLMMLVCTDLTIFMRTKMRIDETATEIALTVTQSQDLYDSDFTGFFNAAQTVANPTNVTTIITGIVNTNGTQSISWQRPVLPGTFTSLFGTPGSIKPLPSDYVVPTGGTLIAVEVFTAASPWVLSASLMGGAGSTSLRAYALYQPRLGSLSAVTAGNRP